MNISAWIVGVVVAAVARQDVAGERGSQLALVPEGLEVLTHIFYRTNLRAFGSRSSIAWSADGRMVAYAAQRGDEYVPVVNSEVGQAFGYVYEPFVAGGHAFFHVARTKDEDEERHWLWIDGKLHGPEDWMGDVAVRADGKQACYWTGPGARFGNGGAGSHKSVLVLASDKGSQWSLTRGDDWLECGIVRYSAGGPSACAAAYERNKGWTVLKADKREAKLSEPCEGIESFDLSADGTGLAYVRVLASRSSAGGFPSAADEPQLFFRGKRVGKRHAALSSATVDPAGAHVAYVVARGDGREGRTVAVDEEASPHGSFDFVTELAFDPKGARLAFVGVRGGRESETPGVIVGGQWTVVVRGVASSAEPLEHAGFLEVRDLRWDASGERLAYCARDESGWRVVCGETRSEAHTDVGPPVFAADGRSLGFGSRDARELWWRELALP